MAYRDEDERTQERARALLADLDRLTGRRCQDCAGQLCGHQLLVNLAMGLEDAPRCPRCLARRLERAEDELCEAVCDYLLHRDCYRQAWDAASQREGLPRSERPACLRPRAAGGASAAVQPTDTPPAEADAVWDAGALACGDLVLALRGRLAALPPGAVLRVVARDPAAPEDLPSWCRLTGHRLVRAEHPDYFIRRKEG